MAGDENDKSALERVTLVHAVFIGALTVVVFFISVCIIRYRHMKRARGLRAIPRSRVPVTRKDIPSGQASVIEANTVRSLGLSAPPLVPPEGFLGWGQPGSDFAQVHFKTSIAKSHQVLEAAAINRHPVLYRESHTTVAEYVAFLARVIRGLDSHLVAWYVDVYLCARFSPTEYSLDDYKAFMDRFVVLIDAIESPALDLDLASVSKSRFETIVSAGLLSPAMAPVH